MKDNDKDSQSRTKAIRAVILDYGLVLCRAPQKEHVDRMAAALRVDHQTFWRLYEKDRGPLDKGDVTPTAYWRAFARDAGAKVDAFTLQRLQNLDIEMWETLEEPLLQWTHILRANGYKTALLSNLNPQFAEHLRKNRSWLGLFTLCVFSGEVRLIKPDPAIFRYTLEKLGAQPSEALFVDDRLSNVTIARSLGLEAIQFTTLPKLNRALRDTGFPHLVTL